MQEFTNWLSYQEIDGYNAIINMILTTRGYGKSYGLKKKVISKYLKKGERFIYLVRRPQTIQDIMQFNINVFGDVAEQELYEQEITTTRKGIMYGEEFMGYLLPLSKAKTLKIGAFPDVTTVMFDEFLIEDLAKDTYLKGEVDLFTNLMDTIMRNRNNVKAYLLGNATTFYNPYAIKWKLNKPFGNYAQMTKDKRYLVYVRAPEDFIEYRKNCVMGKLMKDTEYEQFALYNRFQAEKAGFIEKRSPNSTYYATLVISHERIGVWMGGRRECFYISPVTEKTENVYAMDVESHGVDTVLMPRIKTSSPLFIVVEAYRQALVRFENMKVKEIFMNGLTKSI